MTPVFCHELHLPDAAAHDPADWESVLAALSASLRAPHLRLLSYINPIDPDEFESVRRAHMARQPRELGRRWIEQEARMLSYALRQTPGWSMRHFLLAWGRPLRALADWLTENAHPPEPLASGGYAEGLHHLKPAMPGAPYVTVLATYDFKKGSTWDWSYPWADLISRADGPMILSLDAVRLPDEKVRLAREGLLNLAKVSPNDPDAALLARQAIDAVQSGDEFYELRLAVLLTDTSLKRLDARAARLVNAYESTLAFSRLEGQQMEALEFFSAVEHPKLGTRSATSAHSFVLGSALPVAFGGLGGVVNRVAPDGVYIGFRSGLNAQPLGPVHWSPFSDSNRAAHVGFLGQIGSGKTVGMSALLARFRATEGTPIVFLEPIGNSAKLAALLERDPGLRFHRLDWETLRLNPLDWIPETLVIADGLSEQESHVETILEVMLGRRLDNLEKGFLARALQMIYRGFSPDALEDPTQAPRLELLCDALAAFRHEPYGEAADRLSHQIAGKFVDGGLGRTFNAATGLPLTFDGADLFDASAVAGTDSGNRAMQQIVYYAIFAWFLRVARRDRRRGRRVRRIFAVDEYYAMSQSAYLKERLNLMVRTLRNLHTSVWVAEQTLSTFARADEKSLIANVPYWFVFRQERIEADLAPDVFGRRCPAQFVDVLPQLPQGVAVALLDQTLLLQLSLLRLEYDTLVKG